MRERAEALLRRGVFAAARCPERGTEYEVRGGDAALPAARRRARAGLCLGGGRKPPKQRPLAVGASERGDAERGVVGGVGVTGGGEAVGGRGPGKTQDLGT